LESERQPLCDRQVLRGEYYLRGQNWSHCPGCQSYKWVGIQKLCRRYFLHQEQPGGARGNRHYLFLWRVWNVAPTSNTCHGQRGSGSGRGWCRTAIFGLGIGSFLGNFLLPIIGTTKVYRSLLINLILFAIFLSVLSWSSWFRVSWVLFLLVGLIGLGSVWPLATSLIQLESPAEMKGRVMGILQFTPGFHFLGAYPLALAAEQFGWGVAMTATAVATLVVTIWFGVIRGGAPAVNIQINKGNSAE